MVDQLKDRNELCRKCHKPITKSTDDWYEGFCEDCYKQEIGESIDFRILTEAENCGY